MNPFRWRRATPDDVAFWEAYNRLREAYVVHLQQEVTDLRHLLESQRRMVEDMRERMVQAQQTARDLEFALNLTGFTYAPPQRMPEWGGHVGPIVVTRSLAPSPGPSEWRKGS